VKPITGTLRIRTTAGGAEFAKESQIGKGLENINSHDGIYEFKLWQDDWFYGTLFIFPNGEAKLVPEGPESK